MLRILLVTGEASGDIHGAHLALALRALNPAVELIGVGGSRMLAAGVYLLPNVDRVDAMGVPGTRQLLKGWKTLRTLSRYVQQERFDAIILIDSPGLNLRLAKAASKISLIRFLTSSGSMAAVMAVYPERSENRTVACRRSLSNAATECVAKLWPQLPQYLKSCGFSK